VADHERVVSWHARTIVRLKDTLDHYGRYPPDISDEEFLAYKECLYLREPHRGTINPYKFARNDHPLLWYPERRWRSHSLPGACRPGNRRKQSLAA